MESRAKEGRNGEGLLTKEGEVKARWQKHFMEILKRPFPEVVAEVDETNVMNDSIVIVEVTIRKENKSALREMKSGRAPGIDNITTDLLRGNTDTTVNIWAIQHNLGERKGPRGLVQRA